MKKHRTINMRGYVNPNLNPKLLEVYKEMERLEEPLNDIDKVGFKT